MNDKPCPQPHCEGRMVFKRTDKACEFGTSADDTGFTIDVYECTDCGAIEID